MRRVAAAVLAGMLLLILMEWVAAVRAAPAELRAAYAQWLMEVQADSGSQPEVVGSQEVDASGVAGPVQGVQSALPPLRFPHGAGILRLWVDPARLSQRLGARIVPGTVSGGVAMPEVGMTAMPTIPWPPELLAVPLLGAVLWGLTRAQPVEGSEVLANVSHELRTPLTSIIGYVDVLQQRVDPETRAVLQKVSRNAHALLDMINRLLDLSRINSGRIEMTVQSVPLGECVEAAWNMVEPQLAAKGLAFQVALPEEPLVVQGSFDRLQQVFANLLGNAVKFTERGEVGVRGAVEGRMARIDVWDTGIGIAAKDLPHIFEQFRQADGSIRRRFGGSGLGLAICKKIVEMHGGQLGVESRPGAGSTFTVRIPLERRR